MNAGFTRYEIGLGRIIDCVTIPDRPEWRNLYYDQGIAVIRGQYNASTHRVVAGAAVEREHMGAVCDRLQITADGADTSAITGLPVPCVALISGPTGVTELTVPDGALLFSASIPGDYRVQIEAFPVRCWEVCIHAV